MVCGGRCCGREAIENRFDGDRRSPSVSRRRCADREQREGATTGIGSVTRRRRARLAVGRQACDDASQYSGTLTVLTALSKLSRVFDGRRNLCWRRRRRQQSFRLPRRLRLEVKPKHRKPYARRISGHVPEPDEADDADARSVGLAYMQRD